MGKCRVVEDILSTLRWFEKDEFKSRGRNLWRFPRRNGWYWVQTRKDIVCSLLEPGAYSELPRIRTVWIPFCTWLYQTGLSLLIDFLNFCSILIKHFFLNSFRWRSIWFFLCLAVGRGHFLQVKVDGHHSGHFYRACSFSAPMNKSENHHSRLASSQSWMQMIGCFFMT